MEWTVCGHNGNNREQRRKVVEPEETHKILEAFVVKSRRMTEDILPLIRTLVGHPEQAAHVTEVVDRASRLARHIRGMSAALGLEHLAAPAEALEYVLQHICASGQGFTPQQLSLVVESCTFLHQGLELVLREKSDHRLAASAAALSAAILASLDVDEASVRGGRTSDPMSADMRQVFLRESEQLLATAEQEFVLWDFIALDQQRVADLCRLLHRLKQNFAHYDYSEFERLCMALESTLHRYLQGEFFQTEYPERVFLRCIDAMRAAVSEFARTEEMTITGLEQHLLAVQGLIRQPIGELLIEAGLVDPQTVDEALAMQRSSRTDQPRRLGEVLVAMGEITEEQVQHVLTKQQTTRAREQEAEAMLAAEGAKATAVTRLPLTSEETRVESRTLARMLNLIRQLSALPLPPSLHPLVAELQHLARTCDQSLLSSCSDCFQRIVHDLAMEFRKRVHFSIEGAEILRDEGDLAVVADLLLPLLRNSVEHGLETLDEREQVGKKKSGRLSLLALRQGAELWISVEDDGRGIDVQKIAAYCSAKGWVAAGESGRLTGAELLQIFLDQQADRPAEILEEASAFRGLAAVNSQLRSLHGTMEVWSKVGKGTRITVRLPRAS
jgi:two-component system chemotaxis sensor kinase CheA